MLNASINAIKLCGQQMLPLRGHREVEVEGDTHNKGVFRAILNTIALYDNTVKEVLRRSGQETVVRVKVASIIYLPHNSERAD